MFPHTLYDMNRKLWIKIVNILPSGLKFVFINLMILILVTL